MGFLTLHTKVKKDVGGSLFAFITPENGPNILPFGISIFATSPADLNSGGRQLASSEKKYFKMLTLASCFLNLIRFDHRNS